MHVMERLGIEAGVGTHICRCLASHIPVLHLSPQLLRFPPGFLLTYALGQGVVPVFEFLPLSPGVLDRVQVPGFDLAQHQLLQAFRE